MFKGKIWFSSSSPKHNSLGTTQRPAMKEEWRKGRETREQDILFFPSLPGYCASFKHYSNIVSLLPASSLAAVSRLAVHEDLFLEEGKRRGSLDSGVELALGWDIGDEGANGDEFGGVGEGGVRMGNGNGYWTSAGLDEVVEERLFDFWRSVGRKFTGVREVWIVGEGEGGGCFES